MTHPFLSSLATLAIVGLVSGNASTCGPTRPSAVPHCDKGDMGSCGNACCTVDVGLPINSDMVYASVKKYLESGGTDGSFTYSFGANKAGENPSDDLRPYGIPWQYIFQGTHVTTKGYVDTINLNIKKSGNDTILRLFNVADIHGALGDNGQSYKTLHYMLADVFPNATMHIAYGCGVGN